MKRASEQEDHPIAPRGRRAAEVGLILVLFFVAGGSPPPDVNEPHYLTRLKHFWNPDWCAGDLFLESPDAHFTIVLTLGWATKWLPLVAFAWLARMLAWVGLAWAWQRLSWRVAPAPWCSVLTAALWVVGMQQLHFAGEWVIGGVESKSFAYILVLLALKQYLDGAWRRVWVLLGVACALHALVGAWSILVLFCLWAIYHRDEAPLSAMTSSLLLGGLVALAGVAPPIVMNWGATAEVVRQANQVYVFDRLPHHLSMLSMPPEWLSERGARHTLMLTLLAITPWIAARRTPNRESEDGTEPLWRLARFAWGAAVLMTLGLAIEASLASNPAAAAGLLRYYWLRLSDIAAPLAVSLAVGHLMAQSIRQQRASAPLCLLSLLLLCGWHLHERLDAEGQRAIPPADRRMASYADWCDACNWVRENTPEGSLFLVPRNSLSFKWRAERAEVATWKDVPQNAPALLAWRDRIEDIYSLPGTDGAQRISSLSELGAERLRELGSKYRARYVLTYDKRPVSLAVAYRTATYVVYDLQPSLRQETAPEREP